MQSRREYLRDRERQELLAAEKSTDRRARRAHEELAARYAWQRELQARITEEAGGTPSTRQERFELSHSGPHCPLLNPAAGAPEFFGLHTVLVGKRDRLRVVSGVEVLDAGYVSPIPRALSS